MRIYVVSGFLGLPSDWKALSFGPELEHREIIPQPSLQAWAEHFNESIKRDGAEKRLLMGYSMGGRLAMHALLAESSLWSGAVIVSAHPGLTEHHDRVNRHMQDIKWAERFENDPWREVIHDWNQQAVFDGAPAFSRFEQDYSRSNLAKIMRHFSLGLQENLRLQLHSLTLPILYVAGQKDLRYSVLAKECAENHTKAQLWIAPEAGHRVPWQQSVAFQQQVIKFINEV